MRTGKLVVLAALVLIFGLTGSADAGVYIKMLNHTDAMNVMGQSSPARDDTTVLWMSGDMGYQDHGTEGVTIFRGDKQMIYLVSPETKSYVEVSLDPNAPPAAANPMAAMMGTPTVTVTPTDETKKIGDWDAKKYVVSIAMGPMKMTNDHWATEDINIDAEKYQALSSGMMMQLPGFAEAMKELYKIKGMVVESKGVVNIMGTEVGNWTKVLESAEKDPPEGIFDIPEGYEKVDMLRPGR
ncbi:MAG: hypothetical protein KKA42_15440 [candidate division Zixibacteria bacterium]|nr:hypothetical protein [candidate division Zixibacteria bacterium]